MSGGLDSVSAASWLTQQLNDINRRADYKLYPKGSGYVPPFAKPPVALTDRWGAGGVWVGQRSRSTSQRSRSTPFCFD